jgi:dihydrofolate synthase/folylpolyglutamate synthase
MNYSEALEYIHSVNWTFCKPGLERITALCEALGNPQNDLKFIHVAGTNGKGSFCSMTESVLRAAGYKTGLYTSPYIKVFNERMQVCGEMISNEELSELTEYIKPICDAMTDKPTEFELITAIAFEYFKRHECDVVVLEAGMGGRLDSTNIIRAPLLSVITGIALDHTAFLGDTVEKIAAEKAGIIKDKCAVLWGGEDISAGGVIEKTAKERESEFFFVDYAKLQNVNADLDGTTLDFGEHKDIKINLLGLYQPKNTAVVLSAIDILRKQGMDIPEDAVKRGLLRARWQARFEILSRDPLVIFDGAHNPQGIDSAVNSIKHYFKDKKVYVMTGVLKDKDYDVISTRLSEIASRAFVMTPENPRALPAEEYAKILKAKGVEAKDYGTVKEAFEEAKKTAKKDGVPLVCLGSLYVYSSL